MQAMLFAAGLGTRLKPLTEKTPKALVKVNGQTLLSHNIERLAKAGFTRIVINVHHFSDKVIEYIESLTYNNVNLCISDESNQLMDTGGGLKQAEEFFTDTSPIVIQNVDILSSINYSSLIQHHVKLNSDATLAVRQRDSSRQLLFSDQMELNGWVNKKTEEKIIINNNLANSEWAFSGIHVINKSMVTQMTPKKVFGIIPYYLDTAKQKNIVGFEHNNDYWFDIGTNDKLVKAEAFFQISKNIVVPVSRFYLPCLLYST